MEVLLVDVHNGIFNVNLGNQPNNPIIVGLFSGETYLGISVESDPEMTPRDAVKLGKQWKHWAVYGWVGGETGRGVGPGVVGAVVQLLAHHIDVTEFREFRHLHRCACPV